MFRPFSFFHVRFGICFWQPRQLFVWKLLQMRAQPQVTFKSLFVLSETCKICPFQNIFSFSWQLHWHLNLQYPIKRMRSVVGAQSTSQKIYSSLVFRTNFHLCNFVANIRFYLHLNAAILCMFFLPKNMFFLFWLKKFQK